MYDVICDVIYKFVIRNLIGACFAAGGRDGAVVTLVSRIYHELSIGQCTEEVARTLLKVLSEHGSELELHHRSKFIVVLR